MSDEHDSLISSAYNDGYDEGYQDAVAAMQPFPDQVLGGADLIFLGDVLRALGKWKEGSG